MVQGIGYKGSEYPTAIGKIHLREYSLWGGMLLRCIKKYWDKYPTYNGVTCSDNFKSYSFFYEWCQTQKGFNSKDINGKSWQLDKDLLIKGNKLYSENTCVFVPLRINQLLVKRTNHRGEHPIGVKMCSDKKSFEASCSITTNKRQYLGHFKTAYDAFQAYKAFKEGLIKEVANEYKEMLDYRAYEALMNYQVEITD